MSTHRPGSGGLFDSSALCGFSTDDGPLRMHDYDYDCPECKSLSGEHVDTTSVGGVNGGQGDSFPARGADAAPDEPKGAATPSASPAPPTTLTPEDRQAINNVLDWHFEDRECREVATVRNLAANPPP